MTLRCTVVLWFVLIIQSGTSVKSLETVEQLLCQDMEIGTRIPHPEFCNVYIMCTDNAAMQISCEGRILYNPKTEICDAEYHICMGGHLMAKDGSLLAFKEDGDKVIPTQQPTEKNTKQVSTFSTEAITTSTPSILLSQQTSNHVNCPKNDSDKLLLISHVSKCSVYYICYHGKPIPMECSLGLYWSEKNYKCVPKELSECHARSSSPYPRCPLDGIDFLPHDKDCQQFWYCRNGFRMLQQCDAFFQWDINERKCKRIGQSVCYKDLLKNIKS